MTAAVLQLRELAAALRRDVPAVCSLLTRVRGDRPVRRSKPRPKRTSRLRRRLPGITRPRRAPTDSRRCPWTARRRSSSRRPSKGRDPDARARPRPSPPARVFFDDGQPARPRPPACWDARRRRGRRAMANVVMMPSRPPKTSDLTYVPAVLASSLSSAMVCGLVARFRRLVAGRGLSSLMRLAAADRRGANARPCARGTRARARHNALAARSGGCRRRWDPCCYVQAIESSQHYVAKRCSAAPRRAAARVVRIATALERSEGRPSTHKLHRQKALLRARAGRTSRARAKALQQPSSTSWKRVGISFLSRSRRRRGVRKAAPATRK